jgi:ribosome biogenesis GTPase YqeH
VQDVQVCVGCGVVLQTTEPDRPGYVPEAALTREEPVCRRCFRIRHYGEFSRVRVSADEYEAQVRDVLATPANVLYVLDVFDLNGSLIPRLNTLLQGNPVWAVINKVDLLPAEVRPDKLWEWVRNTLAEDGVKCRGWFAVSAETGYGLDAVADVLTKAPGARWVVLGMANVGKSTLLNRLLARWSGRQPLTMSRQPGTTLGAVAVDVTVADDVSFTVIDTPGLVEEQRVIDLLCARCLKAVVPRARLRPRVYQLDPQQSLWIGGVARFDFVDGPHQPFVVYVSNELVVHRTKLENAESFGRRHADDILRVPCPDCRARLGELVRYPVVGPAPRMPAGVRALCLPGGRGGDVVLAGLGWIAQFGRPFTGAVWLPGGIDVQVRPRLI